MQTIYQPISLELVKATIGPVIAAIVFIGGLIWRDRIERRNVAQSWFEQTYITDGIDVLFGQIATLRAALLDTQRFVLQQQPTPLSALVPYRLYTILDIEPLFLGYSMIEAIIFRVTKTEDPLVLTPEEIGEMNLYCGRLIWA